MNMNTPQFSGSGLVTYPLQALRKSSAKIVNDLKIVLPESGLPGIKADLTYTRATLPGSESFTLSHKAADASVKHPEIQVNLAPRGFFGPARQPQNYALEVKAFADRFGKLLDGRIPQLSPRLVRSADGNLSVKGLALAEKAKELFAAKTIDLAALKATGTEVKLLRSGQFRVTRTVEGRQIFSKKLAPEPKQDIAGLIESGMNFAKAVASAPVPPQKKLFSGFSLKRQQTPQTQQAQAESGNPFSS